MINDSLPVIDYVVDKQRLRKFLVQGPIREKRIKEFFGSKGIYIFAQKESDTSEIASNLVLNHSSIDELMNLMNKKAYPSVSGFLISRLGSKRILDILEMSKKKSHPEGVSLHSYNEENHDSEEKNMISGRLQYSYDRYGNLLFPETVLNLDFKYRKIEENKFVLTVIIFRSTDYRKALSFFSDDWIKSHLSLKEFSFNKVSDRANKHKLILEATKSINQVTLNIDNEECNFKLLGSLGHGSFRDEEAKLENPKNRSEKTQETSPKTDLYSDVKELISHVEDEHHTLNKLNVILSCKSKSLFIGLEIIFKNRLEITFRGLKHIMKIPKSANKLLEPEESLEQDYEPKSLKAFNHLPTKAISDEEVYIILNQLWDKIVDNITPTWKSIDSK